MDTLLKEEAGITIQRARLRRLLTALTPATAPKRFIPRRIYIVRYPLSVVHLDGYHKLVRYVLRTAKLYSFNAHHYISFTCNQI